MTELLKRLSARLAGVLLRIAFAESIHRTPDSGKYGLFGLVRRGSAGKWEVFPALKNESLDRQVDLEKN